MLSDISFHTLHRGYLSTKVKPALDDFKAAGLDVVAISTDRQDRAEVRGVGGAAHTCRPQRRNTLKRAI